MWHKSTLQPIKDFALLVISHQAFRDFWFDEATMGLKLAYLDQVSIIIGQEGLSKEVSMP